MLAYSSIAHAGYALVGVVAAGFIGSNPGPGSASEVGYLANGSVLFYLLTYTIMTLGAFGVLTYLSQRGHAAEEYEDFGGLGYRHPALAAMLAIFMVSSAGLPPTSGFVGKFHVFQTAIIAGHEANNNGFILLTIAAVLASIAGVYYYLRVIVFMYMRPAPRRPLEQQPNNGWGMVAVGACAFLTLFLGVYPQPALTLSQTAVRDMRGVDERILYRASQPAPERRGRRVLPPAPGTNRSRRGPSSQLLIPQIPSTPLPAAVTPTSTDNTSDDTTVASNHTTP